MGRLIRLAAASLAAAAIGLVGADRALGFDAFGEASADATYGSEIRFEVEIDGGAPDRLELLIQTPGALGSFVAPVEPVAGSATYVWDTATEHVTPNTLVTYRWRAIEGTDVVLGPEETIRYEDDRPELDWQRAALGDATVHWYGDAEGQARRFGEVAAEGVDRAEELLGTELAGPVDVFVYATAEDFFGATGPGVREWTGAVAYSDIRTIFMMLEGQSPGYLEVAMVHEVTHIVFHDATDNPYHDPARWLNEGIATWSEIGDAGEQRAIVQAEAGSGGLFSFDAIAAQFPIGSGAAELSYAQGTTLIDDIVDRYGSAAIAGITAAYREGASDAEALEAGTGVPADQLYADFFASFGVTEPQPIAPEPIAASNVDRPAAGQVDAGGSDGGPGEAPGGAAAPGDGSSGTDSGAVPLIVLLGAGAVAALTGAAWFSRRAARKAA
jgi:Peptidase MA superfamily